jgi:tetratricopeptide (TPR) repeat protein
MSRTTAEQLEENEQYDKAYEEYKKMHSQRPKSIDILERLGHVAMILDKKDEATEYYNKLLELDATSVLAYEQLMDIYVHTDRYKYYISRGNLHVIQEELSHAVNDFKKALDKAQEIEEINSTRFVLANLYEQTGKNHRAIDEYLQILDSAATNELVYLKLAQIYVNEDSLSSAIGILERARENGFDTDNVKENLAQLYLRNDQPDKARGFTKDDLVKVRSLLDEGANQAAFDILDEIKDDYKKNAQYHSLLAQYYFNEGKWEESLNSVNEFEKFEKNSPLAYQMRALIYEEQGNNFDSHINWAKYNLARNDKNIALNDYFAAYQIKGTDLVLIRNIAELLETLGDKNQSNEFWEKLAKLDSTNRKALEKVAEFKENIGDYRDEAEILEKLHKIDSKNPIVIKKLANVYEKLRNKDKALEYYNKFISASPVNEDYEQIKSKINKLQNTEMEEDEGLLDKIMGFFNKNK